MPFTLPYILVNVDNMENAFEKLFLISFIPSYVAIFLLFLLFDKVSILFHLDDRKLLSNKDDLIKIDEYNYKFKDIFDEEEREQDLRMISSDIT